MFRYKKGVSSWPLSHIRNYEPARNPADMERSDKPQLPIDPIDPSLPGNPRYMVNLIELERDKEYLRDSVFWVMFRNTILVDTFDDAQKVKEYLVSRKSRQNVPTIFTLAGDILESSGILNPKKRKDGPCDLEFGEMPGTKESEYKRSEKDLRTIQKLSALCDTRDREQSRLQDMERRDVEVQEKRVLIQELKLQLQALGINTDGSPSQVL